MQSVKNWKWINLIAMLCMAAVSMLADLIPIGGMTTQEISARYPTPLTPAPFAFAIWGLIYLLLFVFCVLQFLRRTDSGMTELLGPWFLISCVANVGWMLCWHWQAMSVSMIFMVLLLVSLAMIEIRFTRNTLGRAVSWIIRTPFSIYFGWITVAMIANVAAWLKSLGFNGFGLPSVLWETVVLLIGGLILCVVIWQHRDVPYGLAGIWGYAGIMAAQLMSPTRSGLDYLPTVSAIVSCAAVLAVMLLRVFLFPEKEWPAIRTLRQTSKMGNG